MMNLQTSQEVSTNYLNLSKQTQIETQTYKVLRNLELEKMPKVILREYLSFRARRGEVICRGNEYIAKGAGISLRSVTRYMAELLREGNYKRTFRKYQGSIIEIDPLFLWNDDIYKKLKLLKNVYKKTMKKDCPQKQCGVSSGVLSGVSSIASIPVPDQSIDEGLARAQILTINNHQESSIKKCIVPYSKMTTDDSTTFEKKSIKGEEKNQVKSTWKKVGSSVLQKQETPERESKVNYESLKVVNEFDVNPVFDFSQQVLRKSVWSLDHITGRYVETLIDDDMLQGDHHDD